MKIIGEVAVFLNGELKHKGTNAIQLGLKEYFELVMGAPGNKAIDNLFTAYGSEFGDLSGQDNKDGITIERNSVVETMLTTVLTPTNTYGKKWRGEWTNDTAGNLDVFEFAIGHNLTSTGTTDPSSVFSDAYARVNVTQFTTTPQDTVVMEWEIFIQ